MEMHIRWLEKAMKFLDRARRDLMDGYYDFSALNSQQAAEFALKALLIAKTGYKPLTHSITELLRALSEIVDVQEELLGCGKIEEHYIQARYPDARMSEYTREEAEEALRCAEVILSYVKGILEEEEAGR